MNLIMKNNLLLSLLILPFYSFAQTISITSPSVEMTFKEGDDFFTDVTKNPREFDEQRDIMWEELFDDNTIVDAPNGVWQGNTDVSSGAHIYPLYQGFSNNINLGLKHGDKFPIQGSKYTLYSAASKVGRRTVKSIHWTTEVDFLNITDPNTRMQTTEVYHTPTKVLCYEDGLGVIDMFDLSTNTNWTSNLIRGVAVVPNNNAPKGTRFSYDWIRIVDPNSAPKLRIDWTTNGAPINNSLGRARQVHIFVDNNNTGSDGNFIARVPYADGTYELPTAMLPPGDHYFYVVLMDNDVTDQNCNQGGGNCAINNCVERIVAASPYSPKITINAKPSIMFNNPSYTSGIDYATSELNNPWDMNDAADVRKTEELTNVTFTGGAMNARAVGGDSKVFLNTNNQSTPINTKKYRYLTFEMEVDETGYTTINNKVAEGWVARFFWSTIDEKITVDGSSTFHNHLFERKRSYTYDLHAPVKKLVDSLNNGVPNTGWLANPFVGSFRFDPLENTIQTNFNLFDVKLTTVPEFITDTYTMSFSSKDMEGGAGTVEFFYDTDSTGLNGTSIGSMNITLGGNHQFVLNQQNFPAGTYFIYAKVTDAAGNISHIYSDVPLVNGFVACSPNDPLTITGNFEGVHRAVNIVNSGTVGVNKSARLIASNSVALNNGFSAQGELQVSIEPCPTSLSEPISNEVAKQTVAIEEIRENLNMTVYPNPFSQSATIDYTVPESDNITLSVYDLMGKEKAVLINNQFIAKGNHNIIFQANELATGTYILMLRSGKEMTLQKLMVTK